MAGPRYVKLDVDYFTNPKALTAGRDGRSLHLASVCYAGANYKTEGVLTPSAVRLVLAHAEVSRRTIDAVVDAGLWLPAGSDFIVHDFTVMNGSRADVEERIEAAVKRKRQWRDQRRGTT